MIEHDSADTVILFHSPDPHLAGFEDDEVAAIVGRLDIPQGSCNLLVECVVWHLAGKASNYDSVMASEWIAQYVRKADVASHQDGLLLLRETKNLFVRFSSQAPISDVQYFEANDIKNFGGRSWRVLIDHNSLHLADSSDFFLRQMLCGIV